MEGCKEVVKRYIDNGLVGRCVEYQFAKCKDKAVQQLKEDFFQDLVLILYEYDCEKLMDADVNNHFNALITRIIINNVYSKTSPLYTTYRKFLRCTDEITKEIMETYGDED